jgi:hypothetical protein
MRQIIGVLLIAAGCHAGTAEGGVQDEGNLEFVGDPAQRDAALALVDESLGKYGNFGAYGDLSAGLRQILKSDRVTISDRGVYLHVSTAPLSNAGHDFSFNIDKKTLRILDLTVGNVVPPPIIKEE